MKRIPVQVQPDRDKPYSCPECRRVPDVARKDGRLLPGHRYLCENCNVTWTWSPPHECEPENAAKMLDWLHTRGGVAIWPSLNLANAGASWSTPALTEEGRPYPKPTWEAANEPERIIKDASEIVVVTRREVRRFKVAVRPGTSYGTLSFKCSDASSRKIREAVAKAGDGASYHFDYEQQQAVITAPSDSVTLDKWSVT
jgi:hypothetical protein